VLHKEARRNSSISTKSKGALLDFGEMHRYSVLSSSLCMLAWASTPKASNVGLCPSGVARCNAKITEDGSDGIWGRLQSIMFNNKSDYASYSSRFGNDTLTERDTTNEYYDIATDFYEYGWGQSFHFATRFQGESLPESIVRHEHFLSLKLGLKRGHKVADLGMGVGGPLRNIAKFSGATITGVTINDYQVRRAGKLTKSRESTAAAKHMKYAHGDFTKLVPQVFPAESLDAAYYIESSCHLSNRTEIFMESAKALKKGGRLFSYEWVMTDRYDEKNPEHKKIKEGIELGNGIERLVHQSHPLEAMKTAGFRIIEHGDLVDIAEELYGDQNVPWYYDMAQPYAFSSVRSFQLSQFGQNSLSYLLWFMQKIGAVPKDALNTETMLRTGGINLVEGGKTKIFTPMYYVVAEKI